jgi:hypothetical protein
MDDVRLGAPGLKVSALCLGCMTYGTPQWRPWVLDERAARPLIPRLLILRAVAGAGTPLTRLAAAEEKDHQGCRSKAALKAGGEAGLFAAVAALSPRRGR